MKAGKNVRLQPDLADTSLPGLTLLQLQVELLLEVHHVQPGGGGGGGGCAPGGGGGGDGLAPQLAVLLPLPRGQDGVQDLLGLIPGGEVRDVRLGTGAVAKFSVPC